MAEDSSINLKVRTLMSKEKKSNKEVKKPKKDSKDKKDKKDPNRYDGFGK
ncbi:hypothetical protein H6G81_22800 [Scytonema hofmannii FACHB-248]|uniref:Uncharacterized protein n=1 Tax=Scytonema hofmannii FACHB-248 TaxID=1842502 RepID=A0ABR8GUT7_9CYAN|nr:MULTISPECIES: hypothetical protein [Nostocales]MBD2607279.1 hypothetical protein [Scytonema hofmannii FACHB-248]